MLDSILITQFLESLMKFIDNLNGTENDNCSKPFIPGPPKVLFTFNKFYVGNQYQYQSACIYF